MALRCRTQGPSTPSVQDHLYIAGPAFNSKGPWGHVTAGGTGVATATLVELATELAQD